MAEKLKGTTTVGIVCKDGVVLAADRRASLGNMVLSGNVTKVFQIDDHLALAGAGSVGDILSLVRLLRAEARLYRARVGNEMGVKALATLTSNILHGRRFMPYFGWFLIAGYDERPGLYSIDMAGGVTEDRFTAAGSGMEFAFAVLEDGYSEDMELEGGIRLALKAIKVATRRDVFTGDGVTLVTVTEDGYRELTKEEMEALLK
ncbi:archaeal proteasome endopeptidase complex subunit beta [Thermococcus thioreducens]|uniref:Proteasome subunit beta n=1 Tax=Thermococcus thioreducens TaxID=277988 RepID=A0A0Q2QP66_9EURY|nr:archaeal proteasome endopeptidase complex subunit beta [Thermococcus thioreducens]ASJ11924.1 proteasome subunit beta [Thermococcus thioreducens]KQH81669.1 proteasome subunit beta [Thermococcus thioreducens]SEW11458.1 proteasome endopeptidase complex, beta component Threonine peptidase. MEROPS family T01A [Thermococcus thioreducens]